jgi:putative colanic acid biosynthesis UDP-glucose lipid carrier transferase
MTDLITVRVSDSAASPDRGDVIRPLRAIHPEARRRPQAPVRPLGGFAKRCMDLTVAAVSLVALTPLFLLVALAIKLDSPGPVFFLQRRGGFRGRPFLVVKFRTMTAADDGAVIAQAGRGDVRLTRVGKFLRRTSIDELPQFFNVLRGEMSLVGPRPHAVAHDRHFRGIDPRYGRRFKARPGITGLAQVNGCRGETRNADSVRRRVDFDLRYIQRWSIALDIFIILRTLILIVRDPNAV